MRVLCSPDPTRSPALRHLDPSSRCEPESPRDRCNLRPALSPSPTLQFSGRSWPGAEQPSGFLVRCPEYPGSPALLPSVPIPTSCQPRRSLTWAGPARRAGDKGPGRHPLLCRAYLTPHPKTGTRKEQLKSQVQRGNQEECNGSGSCLVAESLAGCCYKASPCASMIKGTVSFFSENLSFFHRCRDSEDRLSVAGRARGTFGGRRKAVRDRFALQGGTGDFP